VVATDSATAGLGFLARRAALLRELLRDERLEDFERRELRREERRELLFDDFERLFLGLLERRALRRFELRRFEDLLRFELRRDDFDLRRRGPLGVLARRADRLRERLLEPLDFLLALRRRLRLGAFGVRALRADRLALRRRALRRDALGVRALRELRRDERLEDRLRRDERLELLELERLLGPFGVRALLALLLDDLLLLLLDRELDLRFPFLGVRARRVALRLRAALRRLLLGALGVRARRLERRRELLRVLLEEERLTFLAERELLAAERARFFRTPMSLFRLASMSDLYASRFLT